VVVVVPTDGQGAGTTSRYSPWSACRCRRPPSEAVWGRCDVGRGRRAGAGVGRRDRVVVPDPADSAGQGSRIVLAVDLDALAPSRSRALRRSCAVVLVMV